MLKKPSVNHVSEHLSMMSPVYTSGGGLRGWVFLCCENILFLPYHQISRTQLPLAPKLHLIKHTAPLLRHADFNAALESYDTRFWNRYQQMANQFRR
jgi:hypothetical protein